MASLVAYLDSSDYSVLSDPARSAREVPNVREELLQLKQAGIAEYFFSAAHLTEMAPLQPQYADAGVRRANMLSELCGQNCMIHCAEVFDAEVRAALSSRQQLGVSPINREGRWFPAGSTDLLPMSERDRLEAIKQTIAELLPKASRAERRNAMHKLVKKGKARPVVAKSIVNYSRGMDVAEVVRLYPMHPAAAKVLVRYVAGDAERSEAVAAFESCLRDPTWMMQWFYSHSDKLSPFVSWARGPAGKITGHGRELLQSFVTARDRFPGRDMVAEVFTNEKWSEMQEKLLSGVANAFAEKVEPGRTLDVATVDKYCPGLSCAVRSLHSSWRSLTFDMPRKPKDSDFVDSLHAVYAPYVDVYRADGFMTTYIEK